MSNGDGGMTFGEGFRLGCLIGLIYNAFKNPGALLGCGCITLVLTVLAVAVFGYLAWSLRWWVVGFVTVLVLLRYVAIPWWNERHPAMRIRPVWPRWFWGDLGR